MTQVPVLTYHSNNILGVDYHNNDHVALATDLKVIHQMGLKVITLNQLLLWHQGVLNDQAVQNAVVLTCDDGSWFDFYDLEHPEFGQQISFFNILKHHQKQTQQDVHISNFVIVSPEARTELDRVCLLGKGWWDDDWWAVAQASGIMSIENHSWNHNHVAFHRDFSRDNSFREVDTFAACEAQIKQAQEYLAHKIKNHQAKYFAYPYGNCSDYLLHEYLPSEAHKINLQAALTTEPQKVSKQHSIWALPRFVCGQDWSCVEEFKDLITK